MATRTDAYHSIGLENKIDILRAYNFMVWAMGKQAYVAGTSGRDRDMGQVEDTLSGETHANTRSDQHHEAPSTKLAVQRHWHGRYKHTVHLQGHSSRGP